MNDHSPWVFIPLEHTGLEAAIPINRTGPLQQVNCATTLLKCVLVTNENMGLCLYIRSWWLSGLICNVSFQVDADG